MADDVQADISLNIDTSKALSGLKALQSQLSALHTQLSSLGPAQRSSAGAIQRQLVDNINATGKFAASMTTVKTTAESFTTALEKNKLTMGEYFRYAGGASKSFGKNFAREFATIEKVAVERVKTLQTQYIKLGRDANGAMKSIAVRPLTLDMDNLQTKTAIAAQKQLLLNQLLKQGSTQMLNWGKNTQWAGRQLMVGFTIPLGIFAGQAMKSFADMEKQIIAFKRVYGDLSTSAKDTDAMAESIKNLATEFTKYGLAVSDTMEMASKAAAMGKTGADLLGQVQQASKLAVLGQVEQQQALQTTISLTDTFGTAAEDLGKKINFLNAVENQTAVSIEDLTIAIPKAGPVIKQLGGDVEDLAFFLTAMREGGINASEGANALKSGLAAMINPTGKAAEMLEGFGINLQKIVKTNKGDVRGTVVEFAKALDTLDPLNRAKAIEQLFGKFQFSRISTLMKNVISDTSQASTTAQLAQRSSIELAAMSAREMRKISSSPLFKFQKALQDFQTQLAPIGEAFMKFVTPIIDWVNGMLKAFNSLSDGTKTFIVGFTSVVAGLGPILLMTFGLVANGFANLIKGFTALKSMFNKVQTSSQILGQETSYMTQEQMKAKAVAASLDQVHGKLIQTFNVEAGSVNKLAAAYERAVVASQRLVPVSTGAGKGKSKAPKKFAQGGVIKGPGTGTSDSISAMVSNGEAIIPAKSVSQNRPLVESLISGNVPKFAKGGIIGRMFVGMPKSFKAKTKEREAANQISQSFMSSSKFRKQEPEDYMGQVSPTSGHSFPIFGLGGVYRKRNGEKVFVKPVMDDVGALGELRATIIGRQAHGLVTPQQRIVVMKDPTDRRGQRRFLALESPLDPRLSSPTGKFTKKEYFKQLLASTLRGDKDLSPDNVYGNVLPDVGTAGVFNRASGLRAYEPNMPSIEEQATINLLGVKGGAKKAFAQSTADMIRSMKPEDYARAMKEEIEEVLPKLRQTIDSLGLDSVERPYYDAMIKRLEDARGIDWTRFHDMHSKVPAPLPTQAGKNVAGFAKGGIIGKIFGGLGNIFGNRGGRKGTIGYSREQSRRNQERFDIPADYEGWMKDLPGWKKNLIASLWEQESRPRFGIFKRSNTIGGLNKRYESFYSKYKIPSYVAGDSDEAILSWLSELVESNSPGLKIKRYAKGGIIRGPGSGTSDSIPAMVSNGEFIMPAKQTAKYRPFLDAMSKNEIPKFAGKNGNVVGEDKKTDRKENRSRNTKTVVGNYNLFKSASRSAPPSWSAYLKKNPLPGWEGMQQEEMAAIEAARAHLRAQGVPESKIDRQLRNISGVHLSHLNPKYETVSLGAGTQPIERKVWSVGEVSPDLAAYNEYLKTITGRQNGKYLEGLDIRSLAASAGISVATAKKQMALIQGGQHPQTASGFKLLAAIGAQDNDPNSGYMGRAVSAAVGASGGGRSGYLGALRSGSLGLPPELDDMAKRDADKLLTRHQGHHSRLTGGSQSKGAPKKPRSSKPVKSKADKDVEAAKNSTAKSEKSVAKTAKQKAEEAKKQLRLETKAAVEKRRNNETLNRREKTLIKQYDTMIAERTAKSNATRAANRTATQATSQARTDSNMRLYGHPEDPTPEEVAAKREERNAAKAERKAAGRARAEATRKANKVSLLGMNKASQDRRANAAMKFGAGKAMGVGMGVSMLGTAAGMTVGGDLGNTISTISGVVGSVAMVAGSFPKLLAGIARFIPYIGLATVAIGGLAIVADKLGESERKRIKQSKDTAAALDMTDEKVGVLANFFGKSVSGGGIQNSSGSMTNLTDPQSEAVKELRLSDEFKGIYATAIESLRNATNEQGQILLENIALQLSPNFADEEIAVIVDALRQEAGRTDLELDFASIDVSTDEGFDRSMERLKRAQQDALASGDETEKASGSLRLTNLEYYAAIIESIAIQEKKLADAYKANDSEAISRHKEAIEALKGKIKDYIPEELIANMQIVTDVYSSTFDALRSDLESGKITVEEYNEKLKQLNDSILSMDYPSQQIFAYNLVESLPESDLKDMISGLAGVEAKMYAVQAAAVDLGKALAIISELKDLDAGIGGPKSADAREKWRNSLVNQLKGIAASAGSKDKDTDTTTPGPAGEDPRVTARNKKIDKYQTGLDYIETIEDRINDKYDERIDALDKIQEINNQISQQQRDQLDLADALARGDIGAAARASQTMRSNEQNLQIQRQRDDLEAARRLELDAVTDPLGRTRSYLEGKIAVLEQQVARINFWNANPKKKASGGMISHYEPGGSVRGPGTGTSDDIPAMLSNGEYVIRAKAVKHLGVDTLDKLNHAEKFGVGGFARKFANGGIINKYAKGGPVGPRNALMADASEEKRQKARKKYKIAPPNILEGIKKGDAFGSEMEGLVLNVASLFNPSWNADDPLWGTANKDSQLEAFLRTQTIAENIINASGGYRRGVSGPPNKSRIGFINDPEKAGGFYDPYDSQITLNEAQGWKGFETIAHELGHHVDHVAIDGTGLGDETGFDLMNPVKGGYFKESRAEILSGVIRRIAGQDMLISTGFFDNYNKENNIWQDYSIDNHEANPDGSTRGRVTHFNRDTGYALESMGYSDPIGALKYFGLELPAEYENYDLSKIEGVPSLSSYESKINPGRSWARFSKFANGGIVNKYAKGGPVGPRNALMADAADEKRQKIVNTEKYRSQVFQKPRQKKSWEENTLDWFGSVGQWMGTIPGMKEFGEFYMAKDNFWSGATRALFGTLQLPLNLVGGLVNNYMTGIAAVQKGDLGGALLSLTGIPAITGALQSSYSGVIDPEKMIGTQFDAATETVIANEWFGTDTEEGKARARLIGGALNFVGDPTMYVGIGALGKAATVAVTGAKSAAAATRASKIAATSAKAQSAASASTRAAEIASALPRQTVLAMEKRAADIAARRAKPKSIFGELEGPKPKVEKPVYGPQLRDLATGDEYMGVMQKLYANVIGEGYGVPNYRSIPHSVDIPPKVQEALTRPRFAYTSAERVDILAENNPLQWAVLKEGYADIYPKLEKSGILKKYNEEIARFPYANKIENVDDYIDHLQDSYIGTNNSNRAAGISNSELLSQSNSTHSLLRLESNRLWAQKHLMLDPKNGKIEAYRNSNNLNGMNLEKEALGYYSFDRFMAYGFHAADDPFSAFKYSDYPGSRLVARPNIDEMMTTLGLLDDEFPLTLGKTAANSGRVSYAGPKAMPKIPDWYTKLENVSGFGQHRTTTGPRSFFTELIENPGRNTDEFLAKNNIDVDVLKKDAHTILSTRPNASITKQYIDKILQSFVESPSNPGKFGIDLNSEIMRSIGDTAWRDAVIFAMQRQMPEKFIKLRDLPDFKANGGLISKIKPSYFNTGGLAKGTDTIPAMLTPGEFVMSRSAVDNFGVDNLKAINAGEISPATQQTSIGDSVYNSNSYSISVNVSSASDPNDIARTVMQQIERIDSQRMRGSRY